MLYILDQIVQLSQLGDIPLHYFKPNILVISPSKHIII